jgi:acyl-CoA reductase-like NAD-dependent aldehyde dehydrogenase
MLHAAPHEQIAVINPITGAILGHVPECTPDAVRAAVQRARTAQPAWAALPVRERARRVGRWADGMWRDRAEVIRRIRAETGKTEGGALTEVGIVDATAAYYAQIAPHHLRTRRVRPAFPLIHGVRVAYQPFGVVGFLSPWNYPYMNLLIDVIPALIAGNACAIKPSELTPLIAGYAAERMADAGIPPDIIPILTGGAATGAALVDQVDLIAVTGSTATGRAVMRRAAERLIPVTLELGGKDALIVLEDADPDWAARATLIGGLENAGQACISIERVYVVDAIYDRYMAHLLDYAPQVACGASDGMGVDVGSMTHERELRRTEAHIADAVAKGAQIAFGGVRRPDLGRLFFDPTLLTNVDHTMDVMRDETFGPVVPIMRVRDADEAVRLANASPYGLMATIFTRDLRRGGQLARRLQVGIVNINRTQIGFATLAAPMAGWKQSGIGARNGVEGLMRFVQPQSVVTERVTLTPPALNQTDWLTVGAYRALRVVRRWLPWL